MSHKFPHLQGSPEAYGTGREIFEQIPGQFDEKRWADVDAHARLLCVPWCGDYDNVVKFNSDNERDTWINAQACYEFDTKMRRVWDSTYRVDVPYTSALYYNYLVIDLPEETSSSNPLPGVNTSERVGRLCYFVNDVRYVSGSVSELSISIDAWTTFINKMQIDYVMLAQGHAPLAEVSADTYLQNPAQHSAHLLAPDVSAPGATYPVHSENIVINAGDQWAAIFTTANADGSWGDKYGSTPTSSYTSIGVAQGPACYLIYAAELAAFLSDVVAQHPSFLQTVQGVASIDKTLVTTSGTITFCGHTLYLPVPQRSVKRLTTLTKQMFDYDAKYADIAKLYTSPYAHLELVDEAGNASAIAIEDTTGTFDVTLALSLAFPYISVDSYISGIGSAHSAVTWNALTASQGATLTGKWYDTLMTHDIPVFAIRESAATAYDWNAYYTRQQAQTALEAAYTSATASNATAEQNAQASNATAEQNAQASNATAETNTNNSAANVTGNNAISIAATNSIAGRDASAILTGTGYSNDKLTTDVNADIEAMTASLEAEQATIAVAATNNNAQSAASALGTIVSGVAETAGSAMMGNIPGAIGAVASTVGSIASAGVSWSASNASISVSQSNSQALYEANVTQARKKTGSSQLYNVNSNNLQFDTKRADVTDQNNASTSIANNNASLMNTNAANSRATGDANAARTHTTGDANAARTRTTGDANAQRSSDVAESAIQNGINQAALGAPLMHGEQNPGTGAVRPQIVGLNIVTQNPGQIAYAGDAMLRFGYACNFAWQITDWVPMKHFAYWRCSDVWICGRGNVAERYQGIIRDILIKGTTVWKTPEDIGAVSVYDN